MISLMMLCDFHIHTTFSDGSLEMRKTIDLFGQAGFDVIAITDHVVNGDNVMGKFARQFNLSIRGDNFDEYLSAVRSEAERAWDKYGMLVIPGVEISKNYTFEGSFSPSSHSRYQRIHSRLHGLRGDLSRS